MRQLLALSLVVGCGDPGFFHGGGGDAGPEDAGPIVDPFDGPPRPSDEIYDWDRVPTFELEIAPADWDTLVGNPMAKEFVPATFVYADRDEVVEEVGVHFQGGYSLINARNGKYGFTIHFNEYDGGRLWRGLRHLKLKVPGFDASLLVEPITYVVYRDVGRFAPRANHARVFVNGEYYGVYVNVEDVDRSFLSRRLERDWGEFFKISQGPWSRDFLQPGTSGWDLAQRFAPETQEEDAPTENLVALLDAWNEPISPSFRDELRRHLDVDAALRQIACDLALDNWDGMSTASWNFFFYRDVDDELFRTVPWGTDASFDLPGGLSVFGPTQPSSQKLVDAFADEYQAILEEMIEEAFTPERIRELVSESYDRILPHIDGDRREADFEAEVPIVRDSLPGRAEAVVREVRSR